MTHNPFELPLLTSDEILSKNWPEPPWAVPGLLPIGLAILAGAPKIGKSWLALQSAGAVASGTEVLGQQVECGPVLYLALEDSPRRLKQRMEKQHWSDNLNAHFLTLGHFMEEIGDLRNGGSDIILHQIEKVGYRLVVVDTLSRAIFGKQNRAEEMTDWLSPLQELAHEMNCCLLLVDHHRKSLGFEPDAIADILGSTSKSAMADTVIGLYKEPSKREGKLHIIGREIEENTLSVKFDWIHGMWKLSSDGSTLTSREKEMLMQLSKVGPIGVQEFAEYLSINKGSTYKQLVLLEGRGFVLQDEGSKDWMVLEQEK